MTKPVPIEAAKQARDHQIQASLDGSLVTVSRQAVDELVDFTLQFETAPLPGEMVNVVAGEQREILLALPSCNAEELSLVRVNGRAFVPELIEVDRVLHVAGNGHELTVADAEGIATALDEFNAEEVGSAEALRDGARLIRFLVEVVLAELREVDKPGVLKVDPVSACAHERVTTAATGDGVEVETCLDCGRNMTAGRMPLELGE